MEIQPRVIGVTGFMRTGKDSVASLLQNYGYQRIAFADSLRKVARDINPYISLAGVPEHLVQDITGWTDADCALYTEVFDMLGYEQAKEVKDFRRFLQRLGTEGIRNNFGEDAWVNIVANKIEDPASGTWVVPDVRFPNEADALHRLGGVIWRTVRPGYEGGVHPSEAMVAQIVPDRTLEAENLGQLGALVQEALDVPIDHSLLEEWSEGILAKA